MKNTISLYIPLFGAMGIGATLLLAIMATVGRFSPMVNPVRRRLTLLRAR